MFVQSIQVLVATRFRLCRELTYKRCVQIKKKTACLDPDGLYFWEVEEPGVCLDEGGRDVETPASVLRPRGDVVEEVFGDMVDQGDLGVDGHGVQDLDGQGLRHREGQARLRPGHGDWLARADLRAGQVGQEGEDVVGAAHGGRREGVDDQGH